MRLPKDLQRDNLETKARHQEEVLVKQFHLTVGDSKDHPVDVKQSIKLCYPLSH